MRIDEKVIKLYCSAVYLLDLQSDYIYRQQGKVEEGL